MFGNKEYIYCSVSFGSGMSYYYRTNLKNLAVGDAVIVPVNDLGFRKIGQVVAIQSYTRKNAPYPVGNTKKIVSKAEPFSQKEVAAHNALIVLSIQRDREKEIRAEAKRDLSWIDEIEAFDAFMDDGCDHFHRTRP